MSSSASARNWYCSVVGEIRSSTILKMEKDSSLTQLCPVCKLFLFRVEENCSSVDSVLTCWIIRHWNPPSHLHIWLVLCQMNIWQLHKSSWNRKKYKSSWSIYIGRNNTKYGYWIPRSIAKVRVANVGSWGCSIYSRMVMSVAKMEYLQKEVQSLLTSS